MWRVFWALIQLWTGSVVGDGWHEGNKLGDQIYGILGYLSSDRSFHTIVPREMVSWRSVLGSFIVPWGTLLTVNFWYLGLS